MLDGLALQSQTQTCRVRGLVRETTGCAAQRGISGWPSLHVLILSDDISARDRESCSIDHAQEPDLERQTLSQ